ncbi:hypothetical protein DFJ43DRAFT_1040273 [Lentinula guzmanii]|uniref:Uncharacterized protein n=1 Tax=Lentinula guzmanii TaxID=2804957 RepID=A0AA38JP70_9AGAR|nr:hypothetical protein DFJ43DRAFT_1040273 [Lentinula guzmanii]
MVGTQDCPRVEAATPLPPGEAIEQLKVHLRFWTLSCFLTCKNPYIVILAKCRKGGRTPCLFPVGKGRRRAGKDGQAHVEALIGIQERATGTKRGDAEAKEALLTLDIAELWPDQLRT